MSVDVKPINLLMAFLPANETPAILGSVTDIPLTVIFFTLGTEMPVVCSHIKIRKSSE
jgi:hypothetical protein